MSKILKIALAPRETACIVCNAPLTDCRQGVPVYEDVLLPNDHEGDWAGFDACPPCFAFQNTLVAPMPLRLVAMAVAQCRHADSTIRLASAPDDGCDLPRSAAEIACGETLCEECRAEDEAEERTHDAR